MNPSQKAAVTAVRAVALVGVLAGVVIFFDQESARAVRHCSEFDPSCRVDPLPWGGIALAVIAAAVLIGTYVYARTLTRAQRGEQPPTGS